MRACVRSSTVTPLKNTTCLGSSLHEPHLNLLKDSLPCRTLVAMASKTKLLNIFLPETSGPRGQKFGVKRHVIDLYKYCSNYIPVVTVSPAQGVT